MFPPILNQTAVVVVGSVVTIGADTYTFADEATANNFVAIVRDRITAAAEWYAASRALLRQLETLLAEAGRLKMVYEDNDLYGLVTATPANTNVPGMNVSVLRSIAVGALMQDLEQFLSVAAVGNPASGLPLPIRRAVIGKRD
jgi:hypothetical protein